ncbi:MAG: PLDc_N domain-containing protein, partial [Flavobacteriaceae bacterium]|nr:PLDc_N domain-containing protein [Flavobacteriaceae bacterium]
MPDFLIIAHSILAIIAVGTVIMYGSRPSRSLGWILIILILPFAGTILYLLFGVNRREFKLFTLKHAQKRKLYDKKYDQNRSYDGEPFLESAKKNKIATLLF